MDNSKKNVLEYFPDGFVRFSVFRIAQRLVFYEMLSSLVANGVPLDVALRRLYEIKRRRSRGEAILYKKWLTRMDAGVQFHEAIKDEIPAQERILIAAGAQVAGDAKENVTNGLDQAIKATKAAKEIKSVVVTSMAQPVVLMIVLMVIMVCFAKFMAPEFARMLPEDKWEGISGALLHVSKVVDSWWGWIVSGIAGVVALFIYSLPRWQGPMRKFVDTKPPYAIYRSYSSATFLIALSAMLNAGVPLDSALRRIRAFASPWMAGHIGQMSRKLERGVSAGDALDTGMVDENITDELYVYSKSPNFSKALKNIGERAITLGINTIRLQTGFAKILSLAAVGMMVSWIQLSLFDLENKISQPVSPNAATQVAPSR